MRRLSKKRHWAATLIGSALLTFATVRVVTATVPKPALATPETIIGVYETVSVAPLKYLVLRVEGVDPGKVSLVAVAGPGEPVATLFKATSFELDGRGSMVIHARGVGRDDAFSAEIRAKVFTSGREGLVQGTIAVWYGERPRKQAAEPVVFRKTEDSLVTWMVDARAKAEVLMRKTPSKESGSP